MAADLERLIEVRPSLAPDADGERPVLYLNRELSWLDFNARVLALADVPTTPLLERARFLAIFSDNLDEFFQVRVAGLKDQAAAGLGAVSADGLTPLEQLAAIRERVLDLLTHQDRIFLDEVAPALANVGIAFSDWDDLDDDDREYLVEVFEREVFPVLTPLSVDPGHPFPYISDLSVNLGVMVVDPTTGERRFARVKVPDVLPRFVVMPDGERYVPLEQVIAAHLGALFPGMVSESHHTFRVTRNADLTPKEDEAEDLLDAVEMELRRRRFRRAVRLEVARDIDDEMLALLLRELNLEDEDVFRTRSPVGLGGLSAVWALHRPDLKYEPHTSVTAPRLAADVDGVDIFACIRAGDILVHHPYESFTTSVSEFVRQAAADPSVLAIKQTLYRTSSDSSIVRSLIRAAEAGKQVAALVELKARGDEQANVAWARALEEAGVHVVYGVVGLKTHSKTALVVRREADGIRRYCHIGTGNYNERTARQYEDLGLLTCDPEIGADLGQLFNYLTGYGRQERFRKLLVAPGRLRRELAELIRREAEAGRAGHITLKMNSLADPELIDELYEASGAGVRIDLIVRGICQLRPGVPGLSENIHVRSIVGRFLEHSRIYHFSNGRGPGRPVFLMGSADWMVRNLDRRVEALVPIDDPEMQARLRLILDVNLADDELAWALGPSGSWRRVEGDRGVNTHELLMDLARGRLRAPV